MSQDMVNAGKGATDFTTFSEAQSDFSDIKPWDVHGMSILQAWERYQQFAEYLHKQGNKSPFGFHKSGSLRCSRCQMDITDMT